ncbi:hypothetical protein BRC68_17085 [Halobacteriales archaeon QH_6_64_20]|nr:MAG: hypothetical protein BRC68_17085 [Halobacteriales archaeon QH_6_64_20]
MVRTEGTLGGKSRVDGTRIGVHHIFPTYSKGSTPSVR